MQHSSLFLRTNFLANRLQLIHRPRCDENVEPSSGKLKGKLFTDSIGSASDHYDTNMLVNHEPCSSTGCAMEIRTCPSSTLCAEFFELCGRDDKVRKRARPFLTARVSFAKKMVANNNNLRCNLEQ